MYLECRTTRINVPKSNEVSLVFPFNQCCCRFERNKFNPKNIDESKFTRQQLNDFLDKLEAASENHKYLRRYTIMAILSIVILVVCVIVGNILLNIGLSEGVKSSVVQLTKFNKKNGLTISGATVLFAGGAQFIVALFLIATRTRKLRRSYEILAQEAVQRANAEWKAHEVRWKVGRCYTWIELSLDYKINKLLAKPSAFAPVILNKSGIKSKTDSKEDLTSIPENRV